MPKTDGAEGREGSWHLVLAPGPGVLDFWSLISTSVISTDARAAPTRLLTVLLALVSMHLISCALSLRAIIVLPPLVSVTGHRLCRSNVSRKRHVGTIAAAARLFSVLLVVVASAPAQTV